MKRIKIFLFLLLFLCPAAQADVYVSPEEHRAMAKSGLDAQLAKVPKDKHVSYVQGLLKQIPLDRLELDKKIQEREKSRSGPPAYFLAKGYKSIDYREELYRAWLKERGVKPLDDASPARTKLKKPPSSQSNSTFEADQPVLSSTHLIALVFAAGGVLLGLRRALR